jgi:hypothetical protein
MQGVRVFRVYRKGLPAADLGIEVPPGEEMLKAGRIERCRRVRRRAIPGRLGTLGGCPAVATAHQRVIMVDFQTGTTR